MSTWEGLGNEGRIWRINEHFFSCLWHTHRLVFLCLNCSQLWFQGGRESCREKEKGRIYSFYLHKRPKKKKKKSLPPLQALNERGTVMGKSSKAFPCSYFCFPPCLPRSWFNPSFPFPPVKNIIFISSLHFFLFVPGLLILTPSKP